MGMPVLPSYTQTRYRFRNDDGNEIAATWKAAENTNVTQVVNQVFRLRIQVAQTVTDANENLVKDFKVRYSLNSGAYTDVAAIGATTSPVRYASSANANNGSSTTSQLTAASGTFTAGRIDNTNSTGNLTFNVEQYTDLEFILELYGPQLSAGNTIDFRVYETSNTALDTYSATGRATPSFDVSGSLVATESTADRALIAYQLPQIIDPMVIPLTADSVTLSWDVSPDYGVYD